MSFQRSLLIALLLLAILPSKAARADIVCDATLTLLNAGAEEYMMTFRVSVKSSKVKLENVTTTESTILRSDLQAILGILPSELAYTQTDFGQLYVLPFGPGQLVIPPGFTEPTIEFISTNETEIINSVLCKKYIIQEISPFRLLQYTIFATTELTFPESFSSFFSSEDPLRYRPFEEMKKIPGLPLKVEIVENANGNSSTMTYLFSNYTESTLDENIFAVPAGYTLRVTVYE